MQRLQVSNMEPVSLHDLNILISVGILTHTSSFMTTEDKEVSVVTNEVLSTFNTLLSDTDHTADGFWGF